MAIEKTVFTGTTQAANAPEVYEFLNANKAGYFDSVVMDETTNAITCYVGETAALVLNFDGTAYSVVITTASGSTISSYPKTFEWQYGIKTSKGLALTSNAPANIIISKTNKDNLMIVYKGAKGGATPQKISTADIINGIARELVSLSGNGGVFTKTGITSLTQIPLSANDDTYAPDVYLTFFGQYVDTAGKLTANGKEYYYTGYIALGD